MSKLLVIVMTLGVMGCASQDRAALTSFEPIVGGFRYTAAADLMYPEADPGAETDRMTWLRQYLTDNAICPIRHEIIERKVVLIQTTALGVKMHRIFYTGRCSN